MNPGRDTKQKGRHCYVMVTPSSYFGSQSMHLGTHVSIFEYINAVFYDEKEEESIGIESSVSRDCRLSSLGKPCDAKGCSSGLIVLAHPHTYDRFL